MRLSAASSGRSSVARWRRYLTSPLTGFFAVSKKGDKPPGVQRQSCGTSGKIDNCIVTVHLACRSGDFAAVLDNDLFLPEQTWDAGGGGPAAKRCRQEAHVPDE